VRVTTYRMTGDGMWESEGIRVERNKPKVIGRLANIAIRRKQPL